MVSEMKQYKEKILFFEHRTRIKKKTFFQNIEKE
jgi:hypothetical protein